MQKLKGGYPKSWDNLQYFDQKNVFSIREHLEDGTPVIYINNTSNVPLGTIDENTDYYKYVGQEEYNGQLCDRWKYTPWKEQQGVSSQYVLTPIVVSNGKFIKEYFI